DGDRSVRAGRAAGVRAACGFGVVGLTLARGAGGEQDEERCRGGAGEGTAGEAGAGRAFHWSSTPVSSVLAPGGTGNARNVHGSGKRSGISRPARPPHRWLVGRTDGQEVPWPPRRGPEDCLTKIDNTDVARNRALWTDECVNRTACA